MRMKNDYRTDVYLRIMSIISILSEKDSGMSVNELAEQLGVGTETILEDLKNIHNTPEMNLCISDFYEDEEEEYDFIDKLVSGQLNDVEISIESRWWWQDTCSVELTAFERIILSYFLKDRNLRGVIPQIEDIYIKKEIETDFYILKRISEINDAIRKKCYVDMLKTTQNKSVEISDAIPVKVVSLFSTSDYYLIGIVKGEIQTLKVEDITKIIPKAPIEVYPDEVVNKINEEYDYRWGISDDNKVFEFEMKVYDEAQLIKKLKSQLNRKYGEWKDYEGYSIYSDQVIDYKALKEWVMGYGSSIVVLKPKQMAEEIITDAKRRLEVYNSME